MRNLHDSYTLDCTCSTCPISDTSSNYPKRLGSDNQINKWTLIGTLTVTYPGPCPMTPYEDLPQSIFPLQSYRGTVFVVYYESIKWEIQTKPICECRWDERLKTRVEESTRLTWTQRWVTVLRTYNTVMIIIITPLTLFPLHLLWLVLQDSSTVVCESFILQVYREPDRFFTVSGVHLP